MGRKPLILVEPDILDRICEYVEAGATNRDACAVVGITETTLYDWLQKGGKGEAGSPYAAFSESLARARKAGRARRSKAIELIGLGEPILDKDGKLVGYKNPEWKALKYVNACSDPEHYSEARRHEHSGPKGAPIGVTLYDAIHLPQEEPSEPTDPD